MIGRTAILLSLLAGPAFADNMTFDDIRTDVGAIHARVDSATWTPPTTATVRNVGEVWEIRGSISGIGWGGLGIVARAANAHYAYTVDWVARWPKHGRAKTLVVFHHGGSPTVIGMLVAARTPGGADNGFAQLAGDNLADVAALVEGAAYVSFNRRGLGADGRLIARFDPAEVPPLTQAEVDQARGLVAPGDASYQHPDLYAGAPVPAAIHSDTPIARDVGRALERVVASVAGTTFRERLSAGGSAGSLATSGIAFGCSPIPPSCVRTGGNHWVAYDATSPLVYDGFVFTGYAVLAGTTTIVDPGEPLTAPVFFLSGRGDERYQFPNRVGAELLQRGVALEGAVWMWEIANLVHVPRDYNAVRMPVAKHGEPLAGYLAAAIRNLRQHVAGEAAPPRNRIAGRLVDGNLVFDVAGGTTATMPVREDPSLDTVEVGPMVTLRSVDAVTTARWQAVTAALDHDDAVIVGPSIACRVGGYQLRFFGTMLTPFLPDELARRYGSFTGYRDCIDATYAGLEAERLFDPRVEPAAETAARECALFGADACAPSGESAR
jgi:hypothetical protein